MASPARLSDLELLQIQAVDLPDTRGSVVGLRGVVIVCTGADEEHWIGFEVPADLAGALDAAHGAAPPSNDPTDPPPALDACERVLTTHGWRPTRDAGPSYLIDPAVRFSAAARLARSDASDRERLRGANPGNWQPLEWDELLDGRLGPWVMATSGDRVIAICHTPCRMTDRAAECGVWTDPEFRGQGHAAAVVAEWATILRPSGRFLFYSTDTENLSSQRVADRLSLRLLGWLWRLSAVENHTDEGVHPLSALRQPERR